MTNKNTKLVDFRFMTEDEYKIVFAEKLKTLMENKQMSTAELSRLTSISEKTIRSYLHARTIPNAIRAVRIANALSIKPSELIG